MYLGPGQAQGAGSAATVGGTKIPPQLQLNQIELNQIELNQIEKDAPQPQVVVALGLFTTNRDPSRPSE